MDSIRGYNKIRRRMFLTLLLLSITPLTALGIFCLERISTTYEEKLASNLEAVTSSKRRAVDTFIVERVSQIKVLAYTHSYSELSDTDRLSEIFSVMQSSGRSFVDIGIIGTDGKHIAYVGPYSLGEADYSSAHWFAEVVSKGVYVSDVFMGFRNVPHFIIAVLRHQGGRTFIVRATIDLEAIQALLHRVYSGSRSDAYLINSQGILQSGSQHYGGILSQSSISIPEKNKQDIVIQRIDGNSGKEGADMAAVARLESMPWALVVVEDPSESIAPLIRLRILVCLFVLGGAVLVGLGAYYGTRRLVGYLEETDRKQAGLDAKMLQSSKMAALGKMAAGVAHEINNPLMLIRESAGWMRDLLEEEDGNNMHNYKELLETAAKIEKHVDRAKGVTHRMLGFGRRMDPQHDEIYINSIADQTIAFLETEAAQRSIKITRDYDRNIPPIINDPAQLQQVILNVIDNAIDAVGKGGAIVVGTRFFADINRVCIIIEDNGPGIPEDKLATIFDPFFTTKKPGEGTGLGLAICFSILEKIGGRITAENVKGGGARFTITLPIGD